MSDQECDLMLEALQMHLETIRSRLVSLTEHFQSQTDIPSIHPSPPLRTRPLSPTTEAATELPTAPPATETRTQPPIKRNAPQLSRSDNCSLTDTGIASRSAERPNKPLSEQLSDWEPLHAYYKHLHLGALQRHVKTQLARQRRMEERWEEGCRRRERKEHRARLEQKPRMFRSQLSNDNTFLERVHTSIFYKIVEMEYKMKRQGLLRSKVDHETFWSTMLSGDRNKSFSPSIPSPPIPAKVSPVREEEPEELTNTWAITGLQETCVPPSGTLPHPLLQTEAFLSEIERAIECNRPPKMRSLTSLIAPDSFCVEERSQVSDSAVLEVRSTRDRMEIMLAHTRRHELEAQRFMEKSDFVDFSSLFSKFCAQLEQLDPSSPARVKEVPTRATSPESSPSPPPKFPVLPHKQTHSSASHALDDIREESTSSLTPTAAARTASVARHEPVPLCLSEVVSCSLAVTRPMGRSTLWNPLLSID